MNAVTIESAPRRATKLGRAATSLYQYGETRHPRDCGCFSCLETRPLALRLSASDVDNIRWVFSELEGLVGLGSNFGHMCERIQQSQPPKPKPKTKSPKVRASKYEKPLKIYGTFDEAIKSLVRDKKK